MAQKATVPMSRWQTEDTVGGIVGTTLGIVGTVGITLGIVGTVGTVGITLGIVGTVGTVGPMLGTLVTDKVEPSCCGLT